MRNEANSSIADFGLRIADWGQTCGGTPALRPAASGARGPIAQNEPNSRPGRGGRGLGDEGREANVRNEPNLPPAGILPVARASRPCVARPSLRFCSGQALALLGSATTCSSPSKNKGKMPSPRREPPPSRSALTMPPVTGAMARNEANFRLMKGRVQ